MMLVTQLYDLQYLLILVRNDIKNPINAKVLTKTIEAVNNFTDSPQVNCIRKNLSQIENLGDPKWSFVFVDNYYTLPCRIIKKPYINKFLSEILSNILNLLITGNYDQAYDLSDLAHAIPEMLAEFNGFIAKSYWKHNIELYREKWDKEFFKEYQKDFICTG